MKRFPITQIFLAVALLVSVHPMNAEPHTPEIVEKLDAILDSLKGSAHKLGENFATFLSPTDTRRFSAHVDDFDTTYAHVKAHTLLPIETLLASIPHGSVNYYPVHQTSILLHDMATIMDQIRTTLRANQAGTALMVGLRLKAMKNEVGQKFEALTLSLNTLIATMRATKGYEPVVLKIQELQAQIAELTKEGCLSQVQILGILRLRCKV